MLRLRTAGSLGGLVVLALFLSACGGGSYASIDDVVEATCPGATIDRSPETLFAEAEAACPDGREITWFRSAEEKSAFLELGTAAAEAFGIDLEIVDDGDRYVVARVG